MRIGQMFEKDIARSMKGVVNVGQDDAQLVFQELDEYVVTRELLKHFRDFFTVYNQSLGSIHNDMGVWISGFFGSGKSHLLKMLSYLLENREVEGRQAISYFTEGRKLEDPALIANIKRAGGTPADVILFNIGAKADTATQAGNDTITSVFLKVFNEHLGLCSAMPFLAEFERTLIHDGNYEAFQSTFREISGRPWTDGRDRFYFMQDAIVETIVRMNIMTEQAARTWCETGPAAFEMSTERFAKLVKEHCEKKGNDRHVVFMVDEVGQYIADSSPLMLNLQNIAEDLGRICKGKAWVVVTSQQDMTKALRGVKNSAAIHQDFSRIQDRFKTRLSLSSANVDEVIRKRILEKKEVAAQELRLFYEQKEVVARNLLTFRNAAELKLYKNREEFAEIYPFVPYQFNLMGSVLTGIRENAASGRNLADGERSMLALFKESGMARADQETGSLVPINLFYQTLEKFIDSTHASVITKAKDNRQLEPFDVEILKVLFMIKYVKEVQGNVENLVSMLAGHVDEDRIELTRKVEKGLHRLQSQTLIQRVGDVYSFLTNEEQDINRSIDRENAEQSEVIAKVSEEIFESIYPDKKYKHSARYNFPYNQIVDGRYHCNVQGEELGVHILTPYSEGSDDNSLRMRSSQGHHVIVRLPEDATFLEECAKSIKISKFIHREGARLSQSHPVIKAAKETELAGINERVRVLLQEALRNADIYVGGEKAQLQNRDPVARLNEALGRQVGQLYHRLSDMQTAPILKDIEDLLDDRRQVSFGLEGTTTANQAALDDVLGFLNLNAQRHTKTTLKALLDRYAKAPYGYVELDVQWLVAFLFRQGKVLLSVNGEYLTLASTDKNQLVRVVTRNEFREKLVVEPRFAPPPSHLQAAGKVLRGFFDEGSIPLAEDQLMTAFEEKTKKLERQRDDLVIKFYAGQSRYPGRSTIDSAVRLLKDALLNKKAEAFFKHVFDHQDEMLDVADDLRHVLAFFKGEQAGIFFRALTYETLYEQSRTYITQTNLIQLMDSIKTITGMPAPYGEIHKLPQLLDQYANLHTALMEEKSRPVLADVERDQGIVMDTLAKSPAKEHITEDFAARFTQLKEKLANGKSIAEILNIRHESDALKLICLDKIREAESLVQTHDDDSGKVDLPPRVVKNLSLRNLLSSTATLQNREQVEQYVKNLQEKLLQALEDSDEINVVL